MALKNRNMISMTDPRVQQVGHPAPPWMVNYADLMTELVCFFVIMYALSAALNKDMVKAKQELEQLMDEEKIESQVKMTKDGLELTLEEQQGNAYFESGKAELTDNAKNIIDKIVPILESLPNEIVVEGHTDNIPIHNALFDSNWELSTARSTNVVKYLVRTKNMPPDRLSAVGYGEFKPVAPNTQEERSKNRRVVFLIKNKQKPASKSDGSENPEDNEKLNEEEVEKEE